MNIINHRKIYLVISSLLILAAILSIIFFGLKESVDFKGGTLWQFEIKEQAPTSEELQTFFQAKFEEVGEFHLNYSLTSKNFILRTQPLTENDHQQIQSSLIQKYPSFEELSFQSIGPSIGQKLRKNSITAIILSLIIVSLYISFAFRKVSKPISSWKYGAVTMVTLFHDIALPAGLIAILGKTAGVEIDGNFIVALLVIMGFSVHDTIVVFDRIRENLSISHGKVEFKEIIGKSINQTIARSINTSLTLILVLLALYIAGPITLKYFILTLLVGVSTGVYSSIFVASPLLYIWHNFTQKSKANP